MTNQSKRTRSLRIAHITDCHVQPGDNIVASMRKVFGGIQAMPDKPSFIINTGDSIFDANFMKEKTVEERWKTWTDVTVNVQIPMYNILGNHDILIPSAFRMLKVFYRPYDAKGLAMRMLKMDKPYYSFSTNGWKFIGLNSVDKAYALDDTQFDWLKNELASSKENICIFSHVPILSIASFMYHLDKKGASAFPSKEMHTDTFKLQELFKQHKNVKLCLSGHVHYTDDVEYNGVRYLCGGAVCGDWWKGPSDQFPPEYTVIDLYEDGTIEKEIIYYSLWRSAGK